MAKTLFSSFLLLHKSGLSRAFSVLGGKKTVKKKKIHSRLVAL